MTVSVSNTNLTDSFNSWRLNTNLAATVISNNAVTVFRAGSAARGKAVIGNSHVKGVFSALELRATTLKGGNASMGQVTSNGALTIASNTSVTGTSLTVAANTTFTGNVIFNTSGTDRINLGSIDRVIVSGGAAGRFLRIAGPASDNPEFKALTLRDITNLSSNSAHIILSGANTTFSAGAKDSPHLIFAGGSNSGADRFHMFAGDNTTAGDDDLIIQLTDNVGDSNLNINNAANTNMATISSRGLLSANGAAYVGNVTHPDGIKSYWGSGNDLQIFHDSNDSFVTDVGTGDLFISASDDLVLRTNQGSKTALIANDNGSVDLYFNNAKKFETKTDGVDITGELQSDTLDVDGAADISGALTVHGATVLNGAVTLGDASTDTITVKGNFANASFAGTTLLNGAVVANNTVSLQQGVIIGTGVADTLTVNSTTTFVNGVNISGGQAIAAPTGTFDVVNATVTANLNGAVNLGDASSDVITTKGNFANASFSGNLMLNGAADLLMDGTLVLSQNGKLHANNAITNGTIKGVMLENSGVSAASYGSATAIPVIAVDAQGLLTSVSTTTVSGVSGFAYTASSGLLRISTATGTNYDATISPATTSALGTASFHSDDFAVSSGAVSLASTIASSSTWSGTNIFTNDVTFDGATAGRDIIFDRSADSLLFSDNALLKFGTGSDFQIYHDGNNSFLADVGTGNIYLQSDVGNIYLRTNSSENAIAAVQNGAVSLFYDGGTHTTAKLITKADGVDITGELQSDTLDVDGNADISGTLTVGNVTVTGTLAGAIEADTVIAATGSTDTVTFPAFFNQQTGAGVMLTDANLTFNASTNALATTTFVGALTGAVTGNVTGNASGSAGTIIVAAENSDTLNYISFFNAEGNGGAQAIKTDTGLSYNASTNALTTGTFHGALTGTVTGNVTGNVSGTAATVTTAAQPAITSVGTLSYLTVTNNISASGTINGTLVGNGTSINSLNASLITTGTIAAARVPTLNQNTAGNAATATALATARTIGGVSFNGTAAINLPGVNIGGNQSTSGNATTATNLTAGSKTISGNLTVGNSQSTFITMVDTDHGDRNIHCNDGIGFLNTSNAWGAYCTDAGLWICANSLSVTGNITASGNITAYSDRRLKTNIELIPNSIDKIKKINGYTFNRTDMEGKHTGVIAQEVEKVLPEVVVEDEDGMKSVAYGNMVGLLIEAIKDQQKQIDNLTILCDELKKG